MELFFLWLLLKFFVPHESWLGQGEIATLRIRDHDVVVRRGQATGKFDSQVDCFVTELFVVVAGLAKSFWMALGIEKGLG